MGRIKDKLYSRRGLVHRNGWLLGITGLPGIFDRSTLLNATISFGTRTFSTRLGFYPYYVLRSIPRRKVDQIDPKIAGHVDKVFTVRQMYDVNMVPHARFARIMNLPGESCGHLFGAGGYSGNVLRINPIAGIPKSVVFPRNRDFMDLAVVQDDGTGRSPYARLKRSKLHEKFRRCDVYWRVNRRHADAQ